MGEVKEISPSSEKQMMRCIPLNWCWRLLLIIYFRYLTWWWHWRGYVGEGGVEDNLGLNPQETLSLKHRGLQIIRCNSSQHHINIQCTVQFSKLYLAHCTPYAWTLFVGVCWCSLYLCACVGDVACASLVLALEPLLQVCVDNLKDFTSCFLFSLETQHTIG